MTGRRRGFLLFVEGGEDDAVFCVLGRKLPDGWGEPLELHRLRGEALLTSFTSKGVKGFVLRWDLFVACRAVEEVVLRLHGGDAFINSRGCASVREGHRRRWRPRSKDESST